MIVYSKSNHYNPDWLSDDDLVAGFIVRQEEFSFLQDELKRSPIKGSVQHYVLIGMRGAGKTTLLKRLAVAIRREKSLSDHLVALSFPEELYQLKNLSDFWIAACESLADELDLLGYSEYSDSLLARVSDLRRNSGASLISDAGFKLLQSYCAEINKRAVLLVDNLDMVFQRIDKTGRKQNEPMSPAYWAMREALSTDVSPIVIGGSVRLSEPFTDYDKAFYDFFIPKKLGRLSLSEFRLVLDQLADRQNEPQLKVRISKRPSRLEALYDLTGGNPRAIGLIFELLRSGPSGRAIEDFQRLMDITTPYYKARFEDISEQAQVVMHALAVRKQSSDTSLRFGHTAAEIAEHSGLATSTVSAQLVSLENEGLVEKTKALGRAQYRIAEQLFRLWLQMRGTRRIRQNVIGLTDFLEAMYDAEELQVGLNSHVGVGNLAEAQFAFAVAGVQNTAPLKKSLEAHGTDRIFELLESNGGDINDYLPIGDLPKNLESVARMREQLRLCSGGGLSLIYQEALLGALMLTVTEKNCAIECLSGGKSEPYDLSTVERILSKEKRLLLGGGMYDDDLLLLYSKRASGLLPLPKLTPEEVEASELIESKKPRLRAMVWRLLGARNYVLLDEVGKAADWLVWGETYHINSDPNEWARVAGAFRRAGFSDLSLKALDRADSIGPSARSFYEKALYKQESNDYAGAEELLRISIGMNDDDHAPLIQLARNLSRNQRKFEEAEEIYKIIISKFPDATRALFECAALLGGELNRGKEAIPLLAKLVEIEPKNFPAWVAKAILLMFNTSDYTDAYFAIRKALDIRPEDLDALKVYSFILMNSEEKVDECIDLLKDLTQRDPEDKQSWKNLGFLLRDHKSDFAAAAECFRRAIQIDSEDQDALNTLAQILIDNLDCPQEAESILRKSLKIDPLNDVSLNNLGLVLSRDPSKFLEAEQAFRASIDGDPDSWIGWSNLGIHLASGGQIDASEFALRKAVMLGSDEATNWLNLGNLLGEKAEALESQEQSSAHLDNTAHPHEHEADSLGLVSQADIYWEESDNSFLKAAQLQPLDPEPLLNLGRSYRKRGKLDEAEDVFRKVLQVDSNTPDAIYNLGAILAYRPEKYEEAGELLQKALDLNPMDSNAWNSLGNLKVREEKYVEAAECYLKCTQLDPDFFGAWVNYAHILSFYLDRPDEALEVYAKALKLDPTLSSAWNNMAIILSNKPDRLNEAETAYRNAIFHQPELASPWHNLFRFLRSNDRLSEAVVLHGESESYFVQGDEYWHNFYTDAHVVVAMEDFLKAISDDDLSAIEVILLSLFENVGSVRDVALNSVFVEEFLFRLLEHKKLAEGVLILLRNSGFDREARPLLLAFEAAISSGLQSIENLEPEVKSATLHMYRRIVGGIDSV